MVSGGEELDLRDHLLTHLPLGVDVQVEILGHNAIVGGRRGGQLRVGGHGQWLV